MKYISKAIILNKNKYLLQLRDNKKNINSPNHWCFFGGSSNKGETAEECIKRELQEELLINCKILKKIYEYLSYKTETYIYFFHVKPINKIIFSNLNEGQDIGWFSKAQIKKIRKAKEVKIFFDFLSKNNSSQPH